MPFRLYISTELVVFIVYTCFLEALWKEKDKKEGGGGFFNSTDNGNSAKSFRTNTLEVP